MGAHFGEQGWALAGGVDALSEKRGNQILSEGWPGALDPFATVEGIFADHAFSPAVGALAVDGDQENAAAVGTAKARLEKVDERHVDFAERDGFNFHREERLF